MAEKSPQEKKRLSLKKDHPLQAEYPKAFRKSWPRKRRAAEKGLRTKVGQELAGAKGRGGGKAEEVSPERFRRKNVVKWESRPLGEVISNKKARRVESYRRKKNAQAARKKGSREG